MGVHVRGKEDLESSSVGRGDRFSQNGLRFIIVSDQPAICGTVIERTDVEPIGTDLSGLFEQALIAPGIVDFPVNSGMVLVGNGSPGKAADLKRAIPVGRADRNLSGWDGKNRGAQKDEDECLRSCPNCLQVSLWPSLVGTRKVGQPLCRLAADRTGLSLRMPLLVVIER